MPQFRLYICSSFIKNVGPPSIGLINYKKKKDVIPRNRFRQARNRFLGFLKGLQIYGLRLHKLVVYFLESILRLLKKFNIPAQ